METGDD